MDSKRLIDPWSNSASRSFRRREYRASRLIQLYCYTMPHQPPYKNGWKTKRTHGYQRMSKSNPRILSTTRWYAHNRHLLYTSTKNAIKDGLYSHLGVSPPVQGLSRSYTKRSIDPINCIERPPIFENCGLSEAVLLFQNRKDDMIPYTRLRTLHVAGSVTQTNG